MAAKITERRRRVALHEAAHAVVGHALGYGLGLVRVNGERSGFCNMFAPTDTTPLDEATMSAAGYVAERLLDGKPIATFRRGHVHLEWNGFADLADTADVLEPSGPVVAGVECKVFHGHRKSADLTVGQLIQLAKAERRAARILRKRWRAVEALAEALTKMCRDGPQATAIIERALSKKAA